MTNIKLLMLSLIGGEKKDPQKKSKSKYSSVVLVGKGAPHSNVKFDRVRALQIGSRNANALLIQILDERRKDALKNERKEISA